MREQSIPVISQLKLIFHNTKSTKLKQQKKKKRKKEKKMTKMRDAGNIHAPASHYYCKKSLKYLPGLSNSKSVDF